MATFPKPPTLNDDQRAVDIYRKAARIIHDKGFDATSMGDIAEAVDLTKGGLYYYIKGKEALLFAIMNFAMNSLDNRVIHPASGIQDPLRQLEKLISGHLELVLDEPSAMIILSDELEALNGKHRQQVDERLGRYSSIFCDCVREVLNVRRNRDLAPEVAAPSLMEMIGGVIRWFDPDGPISRDQVVQQVTHLALHGLDSDSAKRQAVA